MTMMFGELSLASILLITTKFAFCLPFGIHLLRRLEVYYASVLSYTNR